VKADGLRGGVSYWDGQFDDALMCIALMQTAYAHGATPINYMRCTSLRVEGVTARVGAQDEETGERFEPRTRDGRVLFAIPWHHKLLIGTTDQQRADVPFDPQPSMQEIDFIIETAAGYLARPIAQADVRSAFAGLRLLF